MHIWIKQQGNSSRKFNHCFVLWRLLFELFPSLLCRISGALRLRVIMEKYWSTNAVISAASVESDRIRVWGCQLVPNEARRHFMISFHDNTISLLCLRKTENVFLMSMNKKSV